MRSPHSHKNKNNNIGFKMADIYRRFILMQRLQLNMVLLLMLRRRRRHKPKKKKMSSRLFVERRSKGLYNVLVKDLKLFDHEYFFKAFKMNPTTFEELLSWIAPFIQKSSKIRDVTQSSERLSIALWYLTSGNAQLSIASTFRVSPQLFHEL